LNDWVIVSGAVNELPFADVHSSVSNLVGGIAKEHKVAGAKMFAVYGEQSAPCGLQVSISWHHYAPAAHQHLGKSGTVVAKR
jgi:hypothetical protein